MLADLLTVFVAESQRGRWDGLLAFDCFFWIETYLQTRPRGMAFRPAPPFLLRPDPLTIRVPDVAYIESQRLAQWKVRSAPVLPHFQFHVYELFGA